MSSKTACQRQRHGTCVCQDYRCPERMALYRLLDNIVDPHLMEDAPITATATVKRISYELNPYRYDLGDIDHKMKMLHRFKRLNRRARGRYAIVWELVDAPAQRLNQREQVKYLNISNLVIRGRVSTKELVRINRIAARGTAKDRMGEQVTELFINTEAR